MFGRVAGEKGFHLLAQWRYVIKLGAVDLAVIHATDDQIKRLVVLADEFDTVAAKHGHDTEADRIDMAYHGLTLKMTGNPMVVGMHHGPDRLLSDFGDSQSSTQRPQSNP